MEMRREGEERGRARDHLPHEGSSLHEHGTENPRQTGWGEEEECGLRVSRREGVGMEEGLGRRRS
jgi:hypothetical protein